MEETARDVIAVVVVVAALASLARRSGRTAPLVLVAGGVLASLLPFVDEVRVSSDLVLIGFLPPLLYATAIRTSLFDVRANVRPIALLSVGLVVFTMFGAGLVAWWVLPIPFPAALALGAVVAPPDAVAATAVARKVGMPRRVVTILEGESLVNDATAIVCLRTSVAAIGGSVTAFEVTRDFAQSVLGGAAVGLVAAIVLAKVRGHIGDAVTDTTISLVTPFAVYIAAEEVHGSGVLAVVITGLILGHKAERIQSPTSRMVERGNWSTVQFILENTVFFLVGLEARTIVRDLGENTLSGARVAGAALAVLGAVIVLRLIWVRAMTPATSWRVSTLVGWAGMRGVVTLAAVLVIPTETPHREVLILIAWTVAAGTLFVQGSTLPWLVRRLGVRGPDPAADALAEARLLQTAAAAGVRALDDVLTGDEPPAVVDRLRRRGFERADARWERFGGGGETPSAVFARLRRVMLDAERGAVLAERGEGTAPDEVVRRVLSIFDVEESILIAGDRWNSADRDDDLVNESVGGASACDHLRDAATLTEPSPSSDHCEACVREGTVTVHLRMCLTCGNVACCDSSPARHADRHFRGTGHPVMRSVEPGEAWRWCYLDNTLG
ncbi:cation:proton antiporter [Desertimonas flava]|uniref:cation:proton antiporter domain-containing protein n=1 Tax=Desertimonas flava TaxID=2064846 RepID=UPI000E34AF1B|nr:cation:proton antiporter [Desertimonas flava]